jgi:cytochrome o ubiquinol oxidase subunit 2
VDGTGSPVRIQVVSLDWKWLFIYPDQGIATVNELTVPAGAPLRFELTSASVMNVFFVPQFGSMIYTMNGMVTRLQLRADNAGDYQGLSAHFSGDGFPDMLFDVHVVSPLAFPNWVESTSHATQVLNADSYGKLAKQSVENTRPTYRLDDPRFFDAIATQQIPPSAGPKLTTEAAQSYLGVPDAR